MQTGAHAPVFALADDERRARRRPPVVSVASSLAPGSSAADVSHCESISPPDRRGSALTGCCACGVDHVPVSDGYDDCIASLTKGFLLSRVHVVDGAKSTDALASVESNDDEDVFASPLAGASFDLGGDGVEDVALLFASEPPKLMVFSGPDESTESTVSLPGIGSSARARPRRPRRRRARRAPRCQRRRAVRHAAVGRGSRRAGARHDVLDGATFRALSDLDGDGQVDVVESTGEDVVVLHGPDFAAIR